MEAKIEVKVKYFFIFISDFRIKIKETKDLTY